MRSGSKSRVQQAVSYARLTLPRPCGMELAGVPPCVDGVVAFEGRDDALHFFIERWEPGRHQVVLAFRAEVAGTIAALPPELSPMYGDSLPTAATGTAVWNVHN